MKKDDGRTEKFLSVFCLICGGYDLGTWLLGLGDWFDLALGITGLVLGVIGIMTYCGPKYEH